MWKESVMRAGMWKECDEKVVGDGLLKIVWNEHV